MLEDIEKMRSGPSESVGPDIVIISTNSPSQAQYWHHRLNATRGQICKRGAHIATVYEEWPGGAGNALGTLYAFKQAEAQLGLNLLDELEEGHSISLYHAAGKGQRLAPLSLSESNNKSAVKLPELIDVKGEELSLTLLEAVIRQTSSLASNRPHRLSVFWGDQLFIPSHPLIPDVYHHVEIFTLLRPMPTAKQWEEERLSRYGLICADSEGDVQQVEKADHATIESLVQKGLISVSGGVGISLGSFSLSAHILRAFLKEFATELDTTAGRLDTDPHLWMPLSLDRPTYLALLAGRGHSEAELRLHHERMRLFRDRELSYHERIVGATDIGAESYWWDFGSLSNYHHYLLKLIQKGAEGEAMRHFFGHDALSGSTFTLNSKVGHGTPTESLLFNVEAEEADVSHSVLVDVKSTNLTAHGALAYQVEEESLTLGEGEARADVILGNQTIPLSTKIDSNGKEEWERVLPHNDHSYAQVYQINESSRIPIRGR